LSDAILVWIVLLFVAGILLAVKDAISNARTIQPSFGACVGCRGRGLEPNHVDVSRRTISAQNTFGDSRVEANTFEIEVPLCRYCYGTYECDAWSAHAISHSSMKYRPDKFRHHSMRMYEKRDPKLTQYCRFCLIDTPFKEWADWELIQSVWDKELERQSREKKNSTFGILLKTTEYPETPFYRSSNKGEFKANRANYLFQATSMLEDIYKWAFKARIGYEQSAAWDAEKAALAKKRLEEAEKRREDDRRQEIAAEQRAEALRKKQAEIELLEARRRMEAERKAELERQRKIEQTKKARVENLTKGIHKPESHEGARAFIRALNWEQVEQLAVDLLESEGWSATRTEPGVDQGIDAIATKTGENRKAIVQVKDWKNPVSGPTIRETIGAAASRGISEVFVITTGRFTTDARNTADEYAGQSFKNVCELWDGKDLNSKIIAMPNHQFVHMVILDDEISANYKVALSEGYAADLNGSLSPANSNNR